MVVDLTQAAPDGWEQDRRPDIPAHARSGGRCMWRTFSADGTAVRPEWRGKFMGFTPDDTTLDNDGEHPTCLNYLKKSGHQPCAITAHLRLRHGGRVSPRRRLQLGLRPAELQRAREGSFATDPFHGEVRVKECRAMVAALHRAGWAS